MSTPSLIKQPTESRLFAMEFAALLADGESLATVISVVCDPVGLTFSGSPALAVTKVLQQIAGGIGGTKYKVTIIVTTNAGNTLEGEGILQVRDL